MQQQQQLRRRRRRPQPGGARGLVLMMALGALVLAVAARVARGESQGFAADPAELIVPGGSPSAQEKLDAVQSRLGEVQGDLQKKSCECGVISLRVWWACVG